MKFLKAILILTAALLLILTLLSMVNSNRLTKKNEAETVRLVGGSQGTEKRYTEQDLAGLPEPVQRYFRHVLKEGQVGVNVVRLKQEGQFRLGDASAPWKPFTASQVFTVQPAGFYWDADIQFAPLLSARVVDAYIAGEGSLNAKLLSTFTVADVGPSSEINQGELMRFLAEAVWFPTALLPASGVEWQAIDNTSARVTLQQNDTVVSMVYTFNQQDEVVQVFAEERYREVDGEFIPTPWTGNFENYQERNGMLIPINGKVAWNLEDGDLTYWKGEIVEIIVE